MQSNSLFGGGHTMGLRTNLISLLAQAGSRREAGGKIVQLGAIHDALAPPPTTCAFCGWVMGSPLELEESDAFFTYCPLCSNLLC
jgi:hypothetical protein